MRRLARVRDVLDRLPWWMCAVIGGGSLILVCVIDRMSPSTTALELAERPTLSVESMLPPRGIEQPWSAGVEQIWSADISRTRHVRQLRINKTVCVLWFEITEEDVGSPPIAFSLLSLPMDDCGPARR